MGDDDDELTLTPEYRFEWDDGTERVTSDIEDSGRFPEAIENLAEMGRQDPECEVTLVGMEG